MLVLQLYVFRSAYDRLPSLGADKENIGRLRQKSLSGVEKAETDFVVKKAVIPRLASSNPASRPQFETDTFQITFLSLASLRHSA